MQHPVEFQAWIAGSNYIVVLQVPDEEQLLEHADVLSGWCSSHLAADQSYTLVHEPDIGEYTALVIAPGPYHERLTELPLAGKEVCMA